MSWSLNKQVEGNTVEELSTNAIIELSEIDRSNIGNSQCVKERDKQIDVAIGAVSHIIIAGGFENAKKISVVLSGHANPENRLVSGWANDAINVSLTIMEYKE